MYLLFFFSLSTLSSGYKIFILCIRGYKLACISGVLCGFFFFASYFDDCLSKICTLEFDISHPEHKFALLEWGLPVKITMLWM